MGISECLRDEELVSPVKVCNILPRPTTLFFHDHLLTMPLKISLSPVTKAI